MNENENNDYHGNANETPREIYLKSSGNGTKTLAPLNSAVQHVAMSQKGGMGRFGGRKYSVNHFRKNSFNPQNNHRDLYYDGM